MRAIAYEKSAVGLHSSLTERTHFAKKCEGVQHNSVSNYTSATCPEHAAWHQLQNELLAIDDDGVSGIVAPGIARHYGEIFGKDINDLALTLVAPLGANNDRGLALLQMLTPLKDLVRHSAARKSHTCCSRGIVATTGYGDER